MSKTAHTAGSERDVRAYINDAETLGKVIQCETDVFGSDATVAYLPYTPVAGNMACGTIWVEHNTIDPDCGRIVERCAVRNAVSLAEEVALVEEEESVFNDGENDG